MTMKPTLQQEKPTISKSATAKMFCRILLVLTIPFIGQYAKAQIIPEVPVVYKNWLILGESRSHLDVSYRVVRCDSINKVELKIRSESNADEALHCTVSAINSTNGDKITKEITMSVLKFQELSPTCGPTNPYPSLAIELPANFDPMNITATINF